MAIRGRTCMSDESDRSVSRRSALKTVGAAALGTLGVGTASTRTVAASEEKSTLDMALWCCVSTADLWEQKRGYDGELEVYNDYQQLAKGLEAVFEPFVRVTDSLNSVEVRTSAWFFGDPNWSENGSGSPSDKDDVLAWLNQELQDKATASDKPNPGLDGNLFLLDSTNFGSGFNQGVTGRTVKESDPTAPEWKFPVGYTVVDAWNAPMFFTDTKPDQNPSSAPNETPRNVDYDGVYEDVNGDGNVTITDVSQLLDIIQKGGMKEVPNATLDMDKDGTLDQSDADWLAENLDSVKKKSGRAWPMIAEGAEQHAFTVLYHELFHQIGLEHDDWTGYEWNGEDIVVPPAPAGYGSNEWPGEPHSPDDVPWYEATFANDVVYQRARDGDIYSNVSASNPNGDKDPTSPEIYIYGVNRDAPAWYF